MPIYNVSKLSHEGVLMDTKQLTNKQKRVAVLAEMALGAGRKAMAEKYDVNPNTIFNWRKEEAEAKTLESITSKIEPIPLAMADIVLDGIEEPISIEELGSKLKTKAEASEHITPKQFIKLDRDIDKMTTGLTGLKMLETDFQVSILNLLSWANNKIEEDMKISEWTQLVNGISTLHGTMFGKSTGTTINMMNQQNNAGSSAEVSKFKGSFRA